MAKIIQIAVTGHANTFQTQSEWTMIALYDDGSLMMMDNRGNWHDIPLPVKVTFHDQNIPDNHGIKPYWVELAKRVISGETFTEIAEQTNSHPSLVRKQVLKCFKRRSPDAYEALRDHSDDQEREPKIERLVQNCEQFGFDAVDRELVTAMQGVLKNVFDSVTDGGVE